MMMVIMMIRMIIIKVMLCRDVWVSGEILIQQSTGSLAVNASGHDDDHDDDHHHVGGDDDDEDYAD